MNITLGPLFAAPLHPKPWKRPVGNRDYRVTAQFIDPDILNGGEHRAVDAGNFEVGWELRAPADCMVRPRRHFDGALGLDLDLGHGVVLSVWHLSWLAFYVPTVQGKSTEGAWYSVKRGEVIGKTGNTGAKLPDGSAMPAHTHIELERNGVRVDPEPYLFGAPIVIEEDDVNIPKGGTYLVQGVVGPANRLRTDPFSTEGSKVIGRDIGDLKAYAVRVYELGVPGEPYQLDGKPGDRYAWVGLFDRTWYVAQPLLTDLKLTSAAPQPDVTSKLAGIGRAADGAAQAIAVIQSMTRQP